MTPKELKALVKTLKKMGITHYKEGDIELDLAPEPVVAPYKKLTLEDEKKIEESLKNCKSSLSLSDTDILKMVCPDIISEVP